jgi:hypothetical protein
MNVLRSEAKQGFARELKCQNNQSVDRCGLLATELHNPPHLHATVSLRCE